MRDGSLPARGAWIEILPRSACPTHQAGRSPHGERGLKSLAIGVQLSDHESLPARGAWIEICCRQTGRGKADVAPRTGSVD